MCSAVPEVNSNDDVTADTYIVLYEAQQGGFERFLKKQQHKNTTDARVEEQKIM